MLVEDARVLVANTDRVTKFALPSPFLIVIRKWHEDYSKDAYPTREHFMEHLAERLAEEARAIAETGIDIIQIDDPALTGFCDKALMSGEGSHDQRLRLDWDIDRQMPLAVSRQSTRLRRASRQPFTGIAVTAYANARVTWLETTSPFCPGWLTRRWTGSTWSLPTSRGTGSRRRTQSAR